MATKTKKGSVQDRLSVLRSKLEHTDLGGGGNAGFWSPKEGKTTIRILPEVGDMQYFFQEVGKHVIGKRGEKRAYCPKFTSGGELECPICELVEDLYRTGDKSSKKLAGELRNRKAYWMNVIVRGNASKGEEDKGPYIYTPGVQVMGQISQIIGDPDYGDITDLEEGFDLVIDRKGKGIETEYQVLPRRNPSPLSDDQDQAQDWLDSAKDVSFVQLTEDKDEDKEIIGDHQVWVLPYSRLEEDFDLSDSDIDSLIASMSSDDGDDEEEEIPTKKSSKASNGNRAVSSKKAARRTIEEDDEDDDEDEEEEAPASEARRRIARRSKTR